MSNLRNKLIRLAHSKPSLRKHVLPLLKTAAWEDEGIQWLEQASFNTGNSGVTFRVGIKTFDTYIGDTSEGNFKEVSTERCVAFGMDAGAFGHTFGRLVILVSPSSLKKFGEWMVAMYEVLPPGLLEQGHLLADEIRFIPVK